MDKSILGFEGVVMVAGSKPRVDYSEVERLTKFGWSASRIADQLRCSERTVVRVRAKLGIAQPVSLYSAKRVSPERLERARLLIEDGVSHNEIKRTLGMNTDTLRRHFPGTQWSQVEAGMFARTARDARQILGSSR